jgi:hypothetical protein
MSLFLARLYKMNEINISLVFKICTTISSFPDESLKEVFSFQMSPPAKKKKKPHRGQNVGRELQVGDPCLKPLQNLIRASLYYTLANYGFLDLTRCLFTPVL